MVDYDEVRKWSENLSAEEKLSALRMESVNYLASISGYSDLILMLARERDISSMPDDFVKWCEALNKSAKDLSTVIQALTDKQHRSIRQEEDAQSNRELGEALWKDAQQGLPELYTYKSMRDAIENIAAQENLSFKNSNVVIDDSYHYPSGIVYYKIAKRRLRVGTQGSGRNYSGYHIALSHLIDERNMKWEEYGGITRELSDAVQVIYQWLNEDLTIGETLGKNPWIRIVNDKY